MVRLKRAFEVRGRASRLEFWRYQLIQALGGAIVICLTVPATLVGGRLGIIPFLLIVPLLMATVCVAIRRLHDRNRHAWWLVLFGLGPFSLAGVAAPLAVSEKTVLFALVISLAGIGIAIWGWVELGVRRGTLGENRFGPQPRA